MVKEGSSQWKYIINKDDYVANYQIRGINIFMYPLPGIDKTTIMKMAEGIKRFSINQ